MKQDEVYLKHIKESIDNIEEYIKGCEYEEFLEDKKSIDAVCRN